MDTCTGMLIGDYRTFRQINYWKSKCVPHCYGGGHHGFPLNGHHGLLAISPWYSLQASTLGGASKVAQRPSFTNWLIELIDGLRRPYPDSILGMGLPWVALFPTHISIQSQIQNSGREQRGLWEMCEASTFCHSEKELWGDGKDVTIDVNRVSPSRALENIFNPAAIISHVRLPAF